MITSRRHETAPQLIPVYFMKRKKKKDGTGYENGVWRQTGVKRYIAFRPRDLTNRGK